MHQNSLWKELLGVAVVLFFAAGGVAHMLYRDRFMKPWHRGGEMLTEWNRFAIRIAGAIFAGFAIYVLYDTPSPQLLIDEFARRERVCELFVSDQFL
jgi:hypothetical protein